MDLVAKNVTNFNDCGDLSQFNRTAQLKNYILFRGQTYTA